MKTSTKKIGKLRLNKETISGMNVMGGQGGVQASFLTMCAKGTCSCDKCSNTCGCTVSCSCFFCK